MHKIKNLKSKLIVTSVVLLWAAVMYIFKIKCPILAITGIRCFGCGMTRALLSVLKFDFSVAFSYHKMFWSLPLLYLFYLFDGKLFRCQKLNVAILVSIAVGFVINWAYYTIF